MILKILNITIYSSFQEKLFLYLQGAQVCMEFESIRILSLTLCYNHTVKLLSTTIYAVDEHVTFCIYG